MRETIKEILKTVFIFIVAFFLFGLLVRFTFTQVRNQVCQRQVEVKTEEGTTRIVDPRPFYVCDY